MNSRCVNVKYFWIDHEMTGSKWADILSYYRSRQEALKSALVDAGYDIGLKKVMRLEGYAVTKELNVLSRRMWEWVPDTRHVKVNHEPWSSRILDKSEEIDDPGDGSITTVKFYRLENAINKLEEIGRIKHGSLDGYPFHDFLIGFEKLGPVKYKAWVGNEKTGYADICRNYKKWFRDMHPGTAHV
jgi:hypothetical protein